MNLEGFSYSNLQQTESKSTHLNRRYVVVQPAKGVRRHYAGPMTSRDVICLPPVTISLVTPYNCFLAVEHYAKDTQEISSTQLPYRR